MMIEILHGQTQPVIEAVYGGPSEGLPWEVDPRGYHAYSDFSFDIHFSPKATLAIEAKVLHRQSVLRSDAMAIGAVPPTGRWENWNFTQLVVQAEHLARINAQIARQEAKLDRLLARNAPEVFADDKALYLLDALNESDVVDLDGLGVSDRGMALAKLTAAGFAKIGSGGVSITEAGQRYVEALGENQDWYWTEEWQAAEREATDDIKAGRVTRLTSLEEIKAHFAKLRQVTLDGSASGQNC